MAGITVEKLLQTLKEKKYNPVYFLHGPEPYYIDLLVDYFEANILSESEKNFNMQTFYGKDLDAITLKNAASRYPLMSSYQLIIIKEAQNFKDIAKMESYFEKPIQSTILVFAHKYKSLDKRLKSTKILESKAILFESKKLEDKKVAEWIKNYVFERSKKINLKATLLLAEYIGSDLELLSKTLDKIILSLPTESEITEKDIETHAGISREYNIFELTKALSNKDTNRISKLAYYFSTHTKEHPFPLIIGALYSFFSKVAAIELGRKTDKETLNTYGITGWNSDEYINALRVFKGRTANILKLIEDFDLRFKGVDDMGTLENELVKELIFRISL
jgi:DNA polymerase-3 subunit delta